MEMNELQRHAVEVRAARGFTTDSVQVLTLLIEELGEVARELKRTWSPNYEAFSAHRLADELADVQVLLFALAAEYDVDLGASCLAKMEKDGRREWRSARP
ncbi:MAG: MazG nucleotide pyrophosphohydrolase domain-containing protein [Dehalococcoidia bacterium]